MAMAPVKLISAKNFKHQNHPCTNFAKATINALEELAGLLGPCDIPFTSIKTGSLTNVHGVQDHFTRPRLCSSIAAQFNSIRTGDMQVRENDFTSLGMPLLILAQRTAQFEVLNTLAPVLIIIYKI